MLSVLLFLCTALSAFARNNVIYRPLSRGALRFKSMPKLRYMQQIKSVVNQQSRRSYGVSPPQSVAEYSQILSSTINIPEEQQTVSELDLDAIISYNFNSDTKTLDVDGCVRGANLIHVLQHILDSAFFDQIHHLILKRNQFNQLFVNSDSIRLPNLPPDLRTLDLSENGLYGSMFPWNWLTPQLEALYLQNNLFEGRIMWHLLPRKLKVLWMLGNKFESKIEWNLLPETLCELYISKDIAHASTVPGWEPKTTELGDGKVLFKKFVSWHIHLPSSNGESISSAPQLQSSGSAAKKPQSLLRRFGIGLALFVHFIVIIMVLFILISHPDPNEK